MERKTIVIRLMTAEDVDAVRQVEAAAFGARMGTERLAPRKRTNILACRERDPDGCFVAEQGGHLVGLIFSRTWGSVGWFGTFAVRPELQGQGVGKRLIAESLAYLRRDSECVIGLETVTDSALNLGLYLKQGFEVRLLSLEFSKRLDPSTGGGLALPRWSGLGGKTRLRYLADLRRAWDAIRPGLDYSKEIISINRFGLGDTLLLIEGERAVGSSTVQLTSIREDEADRQGVICPLALHVAQTNADNLLALLEASEALARVNGKKELLVHVNARHACAVRQILGAGYRVNRGLVRMVLGGTDTGPSIDDHVNCARWAG